MYHMSAESIKNTIIHIKEPTNLCFFMILIITEKRVIKNPARKPKGPSTKVMMRNRERSVYSTVDIIYNPTNPVSFTMSCPSSDKT